ncbi:MAG: hypothetical protein K9L66_06650 [Spirochaetaceae bacterium]|nr:hypothetical protein [Spirochaetaceae bacterium]
MSRAVSYYNGVFYSARRNIIYSSTGSTYEIPDWRLKYLPSLARRLLRRRLFHVIRYQEYLLAVLRRRIMVYRHGMLSYVVAIERGSRPLKSGVAVSDGAFYFGDYWSNPERTPVNLYKVTLATGKKEVFFQFDWIRHIHFVQTDRYDPRRLLVGTGDYDEESGIYRIGIDRGELQKIGAGSQTYRAVDVLQSKEHIFWGSDDPDGENFIFRIHRATGELQQLQKIDGPAYYAARDKNGGMYISTAVEKRNHHRGVIYYSSDNGTTWGIYREFKKDVWHSKLFGYGVVEFIQGQEELEELYYNSVGLKELM